MQTIDYIVGTILAVFVVLAVRAYFKREDGNSACQHCPRRKQCQQKEKQE